MSRARGPQPTRETTRRADWGSYEYTRRDDRGLFFVAEMKFVPFDLLGQWLAPDLAPAVDEPRDETQGKKRLHATAELVRRWDEKMDFACWWRPWQHEPGL